MSRFFRYFDTILVKAIQKPFVHILFGARQTGKSTLIKSLLPDSSIVIDLADPRERARFAARPGMFIDLCQSLPFAENGFTVFVDEAQTVPELFDAVQFLYDGDKDRWRFILCGSSARKLRASGANLLPGRSMRHILLPLITEEYESDTSQSGNILPLETDLSGNFAFFPARSFENRMIFGDLPGISLESDQDKAELLNAYATAYLEEEVRRESIIKDWGQFLRFLKLAASESGKIVNFANLSRETGIGAHIIKGYYQLLEDMFVGYFLPGFSGSPRKTVLSSPRFFFFDLGVRNAAAGIPLIEKTVNVSPGHFFEHFVGLQLWRKTVYAGKGALSYYRTSDGAEIDFILEKDNEIIPIEVKWTENPSLKDARHLESFMKTHNCHRGYIISRCPYTLTLSKKIKAIPFFGL